MITYYEVLEGDAPLFFAVENARAEVHRRVGGRFAWAGKCWIRLETDGPPPKFLKELTKKRAPKPVPPRKVRVAVPWSPTARAPFDKVAGTTPFEERVKDGYLILRYKVPPAQRHALLMLERMALL